LSRVKALGRVLLRALSPKEFLREINGVAEDYAAVAELILMLPMPGRAMIAKIVYRLVYNLVRAADAIHYRAATTADNPPSAILLPAHLRGGDGMRALRRVLDRIAEAVGEALPAGIIDPWILW